MNALTRYDRMEDFLPEMFRRFARPLPLDLDLDMPAEIRLDVSENDREFTIAAELPGVRKDDIRVVVDGRAVSISAELKKDSDKRDDSSRHVLLEETTRGSVSRNFVLTQEVDDKACTAKLENGILMLHLPKRANAGHRVLSIE